MCDTNTINMTFYLLKVLDAHKKKCKYYRIIQKIEGEPIWPIVDPPMR